jgi:hypothetical protein
MLRQEEEGPRSATAVAVLSSVPETRNADVRALAGTERSTNPPPPSSGPTAIGMLPPSGVLPPTVRESAAGRARMPSGAEAVGPTALGVAATLASEPGTNPISDRGARVSSTPNAKPLVDRSAETRASGGSGVTQRLAQNDTAIDDGLAPLMPVEAVRAALAQSERLEVPPTSGGPPDPRTGELVFPPNHGLGSGSGVARTGQTGPLAAEASTRPPERGMAFLPLVGAAALGALVVVGAVLLVMRQVPFGSRGGVVVVPTATASVPAEPSAAAASASGAPIAPTSNGPTLTPLVAVPIGTATTEIPARPRPIGGRAVPGPRATTTSASPSASASGGTHKAPRPGPTTPRPEDVPFE